MNNNNNNNNIAFIAKLNFQGSMHRFAVHEPTFESLLSGVKTVLRIDEAHLRYRDSDGDLVTFDTDLELGEALAHALTPNNVLRVVVTTPEQEARKARKQAKAPAAGKAGHRFGGCRGGGGGRFGRRCGRFGGGRFALWKAQQEPVVQSAEQDKEMWEQIPEHIRRRVLGKNGVAFDEAADDTSAVALFNALSAEAQARVRRRSAWHAKLRAAVDANDDTDADEEPRTLEQDQAMWEQIPEHFRRRVLHKHGVAPADDNDNGDLADVALFTALPARVQTRVRRRAAWWQQQRQAADVAAPAVSANNAATAGDDDASMWAKIPAFIRARILHRHGATLLDADCDTSDVAYFDALPSDAQARVRRRCQAFAAWHQRAGADDHHRFHPRHSAGCGPRGGVWKGARGGRCGRWGAGGGGHACWARAHARADDDDDAAAN